MAQHFGFTADAITFTPSDGVLVFGSPFEVSNKNDDNSPTITLGSFDSRTPEAQRTTEGDDFVRQNKITWTHLAPQAPDQLRQRVAWALSQILVVSHHNLEVVERLYKFSDFAFFAFFANAGVLNRPLAKENHNTITRTQLFAHNAMMDEIQKVDPFEGKPGTGILGRMCDILSNQGFNAQPITIEDATLVTVGVPGNAPFHCPSHRVTVWYNDLVRRNFSARSRSSTKWGGKMEH